MADDSYFFPQDDETADINRHAELPATPEQWAAMTFEPVPIDIARFGTEWEQARGAIARTTIGLLSFNDRDLTRHFMSQPEPLRRAMQVHAGLQEEIEYLKIHMEALEMASTRLLCVASRCAGQ
jgi:hypothetical protein